MLNEQQKSRLALAEGLRQRADHSSESELRDALSRSYYSLFHASLVLLGREWIRHENLPGELAKISPQMEDLAETVKQLSKLREGADYNPEMVTKDFSGDLELFRLKAVESLDRGRSAYQRLLGEIRRKNGGNRA
jgi:uncharacterized protein (UPF0332 family)